jgi:hypothetical protein
MNAILRGKYLNLGVFELFSNSCCVSYIKSMLDLKFMYFDLIFLYPKCMEKYIDNILYLSENAYQTIFEMLDNNYICNMFHLAYKLMKKLVEG